MTHQITIHINGRPHQVIAGQSVASALSQHAQSISRCSPSGEFRAALCGMGVCQECRVSINGLPQQLACQTNCTDGMRVENAQVAAKLPEDVSGKQVVAYESADLRYDVAVVGAGPGGLAASLACARAGLSVALIDDNPLAGGQIWRAASQDSEADQRAQTTIDALRNFANLRHWAQHKVVQVGDDRSLLLQDSTSMHRQAKRIHYQKLILATGARERFLPFPGWTLRGVTGLGGLQAQVKAGLSVAGKRVVLAGTGPLLFAVASTLRKAGANVMLIAEQTSRRKLISFGASLWRTPNKLSQAARLLYELRGVRYRSDSFVRSVRGEDGQLHSVQLQVAGKQTEVACDFLACAYGLIPNTKLAQALGCRLENDAVVVDGQQLTSQPFIWCVGEGTGVGGVDKALLEGEIAGLAASGQAYVHLLAKRQAWLAFSQKLQDAFVLRDELLHLCEADTIVCRCEDVRWGQLAQYDDWRSAKLLSRCGMGACQGNVCGAALASLRGWQVEGLRDPHAPCQIQTLLAK